MYRWDGNPENWGIGVYRDIPVSRWVKLARERHKNDLRRSIEDPSFPFYFDNKAAQKAVWFFETQLRHTKGRWANKPFLLSDWQELDIIQPLYGWKKKSDGFRRFRRALQMVARKNGKTQEVAGIGLIGLTEEQGGEVYCMAPKEKQSKLTFNQAKKMSRKSPLLRKEIRRYVNRLECPRTDSVMTPLGRDSDKDDGLNPHYGLIDEYHLMSTNLQLAQIEDAVTARDQWLAFISSTAGYNSTCPCHDEQEYCERILLGEIENDEYLIFIATVDDEDAWDQEEEQIKANPNWGISVNPDEMRAKTKIAKEMPSKKNSFLVKRCNIWTSAETAWLSLQKWNRTGEPLDLDFLEGRPCYGGFDKGLTRDLTALCLAFPGDGWNEGKQYPVYLLMKYWCPETRIIEKSKEDGAPYLAWQDQGHITMMPGETTDDDVVLTDIMKLSEKYDIRNICVDRYKAEGIMQHLEAKGHTIIKHPQTILGMTGPCRKFEELMVAGRIKHGGCPVLKWMVSNASIFKNNNEDIKLVKPKDERKRIDGLVAAVMAVGRLAIEPPPPPPKKFRGLITL